MIRTTEKYSDGSFVYLHDCKRCGVENSARGPKRKTQSICQQCITTKRSEDCSRNKNAKKHGLREHPFYNRWVLMRQRCNNKNNPRYEDCGGRGISVCKEWDYAENYIYFLLSLDNAGKDGYSVDRIDNDGNYQPGNVKWSTLSEQCLNQRKRKIKQ